MEQKKILIIDDDPRNIFALVATLRSKGLACISAGSAEEGLLLLDKDDGIGVVLMDMMMPDMDGYEAIPLVREMEKRKNTPVIAVTAQAMSGDREKCLAAGADDYISKPVNVDNLLELLKRYIQQ
jgi:CheY-like chemotaxis protein